MITSRSTRVLKSPQPLMTLFLIAPIVTDRCRTFAGESAGDSTGGSIIASFGVDSALVPVGGQVQLRCSVTRLDNSFVRLSKSIAGTPDYEVLTSNIGKEKIIDGNDRYTIEAEANGGGYDFIFTITGYTRHFAIYSVQTAVLSF